MIGLDWQNNSFAHASRTFLCHHCTTTTWNFLISCFVGRTPHANGRNIVGQQLPTLLDVTCCVHLHTLLHVVAQSLKPVKLFSQQLPTFLLFRDRNAHSLRMDYKDLWVVFFLRCTAGPKLVGSCCIRLHTTTNMHATTPNIVGATVLGVVVPVCMAAINTSPWNEHFVLLFSRNQLDSEITKISIDIAVISRNHAVKMRMGCFKPMMDSNSLEFLMS